MQPCAAEQSAVLDIGCGNGSNLLPLAERYPQARMLGIDVLPDKIAEAQQSATLAGLDNAEFHCVSLEQFSASGEIFDYILAMDVYSRLDERPRDELLAICRRHLADQGVAYINYHVNPGWQLHDMLGVMMRFEARGATTAAGQLAAGRRQLEFTRDTLQANDGGYGALVVATAESILRQPDAVLIRDYLQRRSQAVYYPEFDNHAHRHELQVLGDAGLGIRISNLLPVADERRLDALTDDLREKERVRDIVRNVAHRQSLLCCADVPLEFDMVPGRLHGLHLEGRLVPEDPRVSVDSADACTYLTPSGHRVTTALPGMKAALVHVGSLWPRRTTFEELLSHAAHRSSRRGGP